MKRLLFCIITVLLLLPVTLAYASEGSLTWDLSDGILTVSGVGEMPVFDSPSDQPWVDVRDQIEEVYFLNPENMHIENMQYWFTDCVNLRRTEIPYTAKIIGTDAFANCPNLTEILFYYYDSDEFEIVPGAFYSDTHVDTQVYLVSEQTSALTRIQQYDWSACNRYIGVYDVYTQNILDKEYETVCRTCGDTIITYVVPIGSNKHKTIPWQDCSCTPRSESIGSCTYSGGVCTICGVSQASNSTHSHSFSYNGTYSQYSAAQHMCNTVCSCGSTSYVLAAHSDSNSDGRCDQCSYAMSVTISFVVDGTVIQSSGQTPGAALGIPSEKPSKEGYIFLGWFTSATNGTQVTEASTVPSSAMTYYAQWKCLHLTATNDICNYCGYTLRRYLGEITSSVNAHSCGSTSMDITFSSTDAYVHRIEGYCTVCNDMMWLTSLRHVDTGSYCLDVPYDDNDPTVIAMEGEPDGICDACGYSMWGTGTLADIPEGNLIYLNENGVPTFFRVAKHNYESDINGEGRTLLVRDECSSLSVFSSSGSTNYATSDIDAWLNTSYLASLGSDVREVIGSTAFDYTPGDGVTSVSTLSRSVFIPSLTERYTTRDGSNAEGERLPPFRYITSPKYNGTLVDMWTRTPTVDGTNLGWYININGSPATMSTTTTAGILPCFTLPEFAIINGDGTISLPAYTITWDFADGILTSTQTLGKHVTLPAEPTAPGNYKFGGWWTDPQGGTQITASTIFTATSDVTYYAQWIQVFSVTVPATLPLAVDTSGNVYAPSVVMTNNSTGDVKISTISLVAKNAWDIVPYTTDMSNVQVDAKKIGLKINELTTDNATSFTPNWVLRESGTFTLDYDVITSALSTPRIDEEVIQIVFIVEWSTT